MNIDDAMYVFKMNTEFIKSIEGEMIEMVCALIGSGQPHYGGIPYRPMENMALYANLIKAKKILRWEPSISIENGLKQTIELFKNEFKYVS